MNKNKLDFSKINLGISLLGKPLDQHELIMSSLYKALVNSPKLFRRSDNGPGGRDTGTDQANWSQVPSSGSLCPREACGDSDVTQLNPPPTSKQKSEISDDSADNIDRDLNNFKTFPNFEKSVRLRKNENMKTHSNPDLYKQSFLSPRISPCFKDYREKSSALLAFPRSPDSSSNMSPVSITSEGSIFSFTVSDISPSSGTSSPAPPSPKTLWKGVRGARPISPLVSTIFNDLGIEEKKKAGTEPPVLRMDSPLRKKDKIGKVDPKLYRSISLDSYDFTTLSDDFMGKIYFQLVYSEESEMLKVLIQKLKYLPEVFTSGGVVVKLKLSPDERRSHQTSVVSGSGSVLIGQEFLFQVPSSELENRKLAGVVQVYKNGIRKNICWFSRKIIKEDVLFGETTVKADLLAMKAARTIQPISLKLKTGLCYNPDLERLTVTIYDLEGLEVYDGEDLPDTYVKVTLTQQMKVSKTKKTSLVRKSLAPAFNQSFDVKLSEKTVGVTFLTVQLKQARLFALKDLTLGSVIIGSAMFARHSGLRQWEQAVTKHSKQQVTETHSLNSGIYKE